MSRPTRLVMAVVLLATCFCPAEVSSSRILGIFPHIGRSHFFVFESFMKALAAHGHDVHVISHFPQDLPLPNFTDISIAGTIDKVKPTGGVSFDMVGGPLDPIITPFFLGSLGMKSCESVLSHASIQALLHSDEKFDLIITELFNTDCFLGFAHKFKAPNIALSSCTLMPWANERFGNPDNPSYIPTNMAAFSDRMSFVERTHNALFNFYTKTVFYWQYTRNTQSILDKYFGPSVPSLQELSDSTSMIFVNSHFTINRPRPLVPSVIEVGGIHVPPAKKLPEELDRWMNAAPDGVIFFSMGSMLRAETMSANVVGAFLEAFAELPQRVVWKYEADSLPRQPANVRVGKWLPQWDILNHPSVRAFVSHCGLLGTIEGVMSGVPMVGIPIFGDQPTNFKALEATGAAVRLDYKQITKQTVLAALRAVIDNSTYRESAKRLSVQYLDRPLSPMDTAIFWTEYVIRNKGAHHLRTAAVGLPWYQYLLLDVAVTLLAVVALISAFCVFAIKKIFAKKNADKLKTH